MAGTPPPTRRFQPALLEESSKKIRRFAPEPVETTTRTSKKANDASTAAVGEQPAGNDNVERTEFTGKKRFLPTPVETTFKSSKQSGNALPTPEATPVSTPAEEAKKQRPRFAPQLIETSKRSKKAGDRTPATLPTDKTDLTPGVPNIYTRSQRRVIRPPANTPHSNSISLKSAVIPPRAPARQGSMRPHLNTRRSTRQNSFQPELDVIPSSGSDEDEQHSDRESTPSLTGSFGSSEDSLMRLRLSRTRESCDDRFSGYLLALAAKAAEKQLREQALAAFPNESLHEIVEHFYDREIDPASDEDSVEGTGMLLDTDIPSAIRRKSTEVGWMAKEMREHQEKLERMREEETHAKLAAEATEPTFKDPFWTNGMTSKSPFITHKKENADPKDAELRCMRSAASPPMLGADLSFRMCPSPKATKFETDQKIDVQPNRSDNGGGLWGGYCVTDEVGEYLSPSIKGPTLIQTPHSEREDPFSAVVSSELPGSGTKTPRSRDSGLRLLAGIDERLKAEVAKLKAEEAMLEEFDDTFVTQVYNYLSLGYPALARQFDEELAKISRISEEELRVDDNKKNAKGYIGIVDGFSSTETTPEKRKRGNGNAKSHEGYCARWKALRIYILEWARQYPNMSNGAMGPSAWGVRARRGSWAI